MQKHCQTQNYVQNHINITELSLCEPLLLLCVYDPLPPWHGRRLRGGKGGGAAPCALGLALHLPQFHIKFENCGVHAPAGDDFITLYKSLSVAYRAAWHADAV